MSRAGSYASAAAGLRHVFVRDMVLAASIGVHAHEHAAPQRVRINVDLAVTDPGTQDSGAAVGPDELARVVDYQAIAGTVRAIATAGHVRLVETLAERIASACLADERVRIVRISVEKLDVFVDVASVGVTVERTRS